MLACSAVTTTDNPLPVIVIGAGLAGLTAAQQLRKAGIPVRLFEAGKQVAGLALSFHDEEGFTYDFGAHFITNRLADWIGIADQCRLVPRYGECVLTGKNVHSYPYGLLGVPRYAAGALRERLRRPTGEPDSAAEVFRRKYGLALTEEVALPLLEAWSGVPADELATSVAEKVPSGLLHTLYLKAASRVMRKAIAIGYSRDYPESPGMWHVYPEGGIGLLCRHLAAGLEDRIELESRVEAIYVENERAVGVRVNGRDVAASAVISTAPLHVLPKLIRGSRALAYLSAFRYRPMIFVNLKLTGRGLLPDVVAWTPERNLPFFRLSEAPSAMPWLAPEGKTMITADLGCQLNDGLWSASDAELARLCVDHIERFIPDVRRRLLGSNVLRTPIAYPVFLRSYEADRRRFHESTGIAGFLSVGRNGEFDHLPMQDVYLRTVRKMERLRLELNETETRVHTFAIL